MGSFLKLLFCSGRCRRKGDRRITRPWQELCIQMPTNPLKTKGKAGQAPAYVVGTLHICPSWTKTKGYRRHATNRELPVAWHQGPDAKLFDSAPPTPSARGTPHHSSGAAGPSTPTFSESNAEPQIRNWKARAQSLTSHFRPKSRLSRCVMPCTFTLSAHLPTWPRGASHSPGAISRHMLTSHQGQ